MGERTADDIRREMQTSHIFFPDPTSDFKSVAAMDYVAHPPQPKESESCRSTSFLLS